MGKEGQKTPALLVSTPMDLTAWKQKLSNHPDVGVDQSATFQSAKRNMQSATQNPKVIEEYLAKQVAEGNILGPFSKEGAPMVHINRFGTIPKKHQPGKWRLITDLSFPEGASVNEAIDPKLCTLSYITVDEVAKAALSLGQGALIDKIEIKSAYHLIPDSASKP